MTKKKDLVTMPKIFSNSERDNIEKRLLSSAGKCLKLYGVRRTTVDEIVKTAHIAKGTFYLFYDSKEDLFLAVLSSFISSLENKYLDMLQNLDENHIVTSLTKVFYNTALLFYEEGIYRFLDSENIALITRKVDEKKIDELIKSIDKSYETIFSYFSIDSKDDIKRFKSAYKAVLSLFLSDEEEEEKKSVVKTLLEGLVLLLVQ